VHADAVSTLKDRKEEITREIKRVKGTVIRPTPDINRYLQTRRSQPLQHGVHLDQLLKRAELDYTCVGRLAPGPAAVGRRVAEQVEIEIKYEGYVQRQNREIERFKHLEQVRIPPGFDLAGVHGLSNELKQKLGAVQPSSLGQAARIDGMTPAAISALMVALKARGG
jgi:tRNA uridine 5-carboxymethylaminomethyl modification enzyme